MMFTITSPTINPSAAFSVLGKPAITIVGAGIRRYQPGRSPPAG
jgi:hypothetical protein